jgi:predicted nucleic acid-binding Zn ribbon protein
MERSVRIRGRNTRGAPRSLGAALRSLAEDLGIAARLRDYEVFTSWPALVGERIARVAEPVRLEKGVLTVHVAGAPWRNELTLRRREIIGRINAGLGNTVVTDIRFR